MPGIFNYEWLNSNSQRRYPLAENADGVDTSGGFSLPDDFLVELDLPVSAGVDVDPSRFFILSIGVYATGYAIVVGYQPAVGDAVNVASALVPRTGFTTNVAFGLGGIDDFADTFGKLVIGRLNGIDTQPAGQFTFTLEHARIDPDCVRPALRGVSSLIVVNGSDRSAPLTGDIELVAQENMQLTPITGTGITPSILISAIQGEGLAETCVCAGDVSSQPIKTINGVGPNVSGDFTLSAGSGCLSITPIANGLKLTDECAKPCCGCSELEAITRDLELLGSKITTTQNFVNRLETVVVQMNQTVLGSRLNDHGCGGDCG